MEGERRSPFWAWVLAFTIWLALSGISYLIFRSKTDIMPWKWFAIVSAGSLVVSFAGVFGTRYFLHRSEIRRELEAPKELVDVVDADRVWIEEFVKNTGIPYAIQPWNDNRLVLQDASHVQIRNARPVFSGDGSFRLFECVALVGSMRGVNLFVTRLDRGLEWIQKNWNWRPVLNKPFNLFNPTDLVRYPLTTPESENAYLQLRSLQMLEDGYSPEDVRASIDPFKVQDRPKPEKTVVKVVGASKDNNQDFFDADTVDEEEAADGIEDDIEEYRRQNKDS